MLVRSLLSAGVDTTVTGIGSAMFCFASNPDQYAMLLDDALLVKPAFAEVLCCTSPVSAFCRTANVGTVIAELSITEGTKILCVLGSANLDERKWPHAHKFMITRRPVDHLAFGTGIHGCVGQIVAKAEVEAVIAALRENVASIELAGTLVWQANNSMHMLKVFRSQLDRNVTLDRLVGLQKSRSPVLADRAAAVHYVETEWQPEKVRQRYDWLFDYDAMQVQI